MSISRAGFLAALVAPFAAMLGWRQRPYHIPDDGPYPAVDGWTEVGGPEFVWAFGDPPWHYSGNVGELVKAVYDGEFSPRGVKYNAIPPAALTHSDVLIHARITEPITDPAEWVRNHLAGLL